MTATLLSTSARTALARASLTGSYEINAPHVTARARFVASPERQRIVEVLTIDGTNLSAHEQWSYSDHRTTLLAVRQEAQESETEQWEWLDVPGVSYEDTAPVLALRMVEETPDSTALGPNQYRSRIHTGAGSTWSRLITVLSSSARPDQPATATVELRDAPQRISAITLQVPGLRLTLDPEPANVDIPALAKDSPVDWATLHGLVRS